MNIITETLLMFIMAIEGISPNHREVYGLPNNDKMCLTEEYGMQKVAEYVTQMEQDLNKILPKNLTEGQKIAIESLTYNIGISAFKKSKLFKHIKKNEISLAAKEFNKWDKVDGKALKGLTKRRMLEKTMFLDS